MHFQPFIKYASCHYIAMVNRISSLPVLELIDVYPTNLNRYTERTKIYFTMYKDAFVKRKYSDPEQTLYVKLNFVITRKYVVRAKVFLAKK